MDIDRYGYQLIWISTDMDINKIILEDINMKKTISNLQFRQLLIFRLGGLLPHRVVLLEASAHLNHLNFKLQPP